MECSSADTVGVEGSMLVAAVSGVSEILPEEDHWVTLGFSLSLQI